MKRSSVVIGCSASIAICLIGIFLSAGVTRAEQVTWGPFGSDSSLGVLDATLIPTTTPPGDRRYSDVNNDGYDIVVQTNKLNESGKGTFEGQSIWWFEGRSRSSGSIDWSTVEFHFYEPDTTNPMPVTGVRFRLEDAEKEERFRNFSYLDVDGNEFTFDQNYDVFTYNTGPPVVYADGSFDTGAAYAGGTQADKWIEVDFSGIPISGFRFQTGRGSSNSGSVTMSGLGNILPFLDARTNPVLVLAGEKYRGISGISDGGKLAVLLDGTASVDTNVTIDFNPGSPANQFQAQNSNPFTPFIDVLTLTGTDGDKFVLQLAYDDTGLTLAQENALFLLWFDPLAPAFVNAVDGNIGASEVVTPGPKLGSYDSATDFLLGYYGVDTTNNTVWAVIDHNSDFGIAVPAPEPTSTMLAICGILPLLARRRRTSRAA